MISKIDLQHIVTRKEKIASYYHELRKTYFTLHRLFKVDLDLEYTYLRLSITKGNNSHQEVLY